MSFLYGVSLYDFLLSFILELYIICDIISGLRSPHLSPVVGFIWYPPIAFYDARDATILKKACLRQKKNFGISNLTKFYNIQSIWWALLTDLAI